MGDILISYKMDSEMITHNGGCHCTKVRWRVQAPARVVAWQCNCSDCSMRGNTHFIVPSERFELLGDSKQFLTTYTFGTHAAKHTFCRVCGITSFYTPRSNPDGIAISYRCVDAGTLTHIEIKTYDGKNWEASHSKTGIASSHSRRRHHLTMIPEELIWEVLIHLPTKSLMRFKCVSKLWYSIIRSPKFAIAYRSNGGGCFRGLLIRDIYSHSADSDERWESQLLFYLNINGGPKLMQHQFTIEEITEHCNSTRVVKGLIGVYDNLFRNFTLCNIATHEMLKLPPSPSLSEYLHCEFKYYLGFDVVEEVFKVLSICHRLDEEEEIIDRTIHVFTFGVNISDMNWRNITDRMPLDFYDEESQHIYINGFLYWLPYWYKNPLSLTAFDVNSEAFESIDIPEVMLQIDYPTLVEICGRPALFVISLPSEGVTMLDVCTMNNYRRGGELASWTRKRVVLPTSLCYEPSPNFDANMLPTGEMILAYRESESLPLRIYIYDHLKNELDSIIIEEEYGCQRSDIFSPESKMEFSHMRICYFEENLISLDSLMEGHTFNIFSVILKKYPNLFRSVTMYKESQRDDILQGICLVDSEKVRELEDRWKELCMKESETEFHCGKMELLAAQKRLAGDALKQKWEDMFSNFDV